MVLQSFGGLKTAIPNTVFFLLIIGLKKLSVVSGSLKSSAWRGTSKTPSVLIYWPRNNERLNVPFPNLKPNLELCDWAMRTGLHDVRQFVVIHYYSKAGRTWGNSCSILLDFAEKNRFKTVLKHISSLFWSVSSLKSHFICFCHLNVRPA